MHWQLILFSITISQRYTHANCDAIRIDNEEMLALSAIARACQRFVFVRKVHSIIVIQNISHSALVNNLAGINFDC